MDQEITHFFVILCSTEWHIQCHQQSSVTVIKRKDKHDFCVQPEDMEWTGVGGSKQTRIHTFFPSLTQEDSIMCFHSKSGCIKTLHSNSRQII